MTASAAAARPGQPRAAAPFRSGCRDALSVAVAYLPFGLALGAALAATDVDRFAAWSSSWLIFAGAAQLVAVQMTDSGASAVVVVSAALIVNARHLLYSASMAPYARAWPRRRRWGGAYTLADPVYALAIVRYEQDDGGGSPRDRWHYLLGVSVVCWTMWQVLTAAGVLLGEALPSSVPLEMATALTFLLLLLPSLKNRASYAAAAAGGLVALASIGLPLGLNLVAGAVAGVAAGIWAGGRRA